ncbi:ATP-binding protein [Streptomyces gobiensis]|uniref:ATP-binding protein n=1 Tax=Streptomyces gobiensis TaxID=2875706 RepID=UPI001E373C6C|nr:ATP-binding protein [Streptomyces gobiensis]UGY92472.1 ATP-binding protein [Streptomyces gobiensis]
MRQAIAPGRFPVWAIGASITWRGAKEVSGVALVVAHEVPTSSTMAVPHGPVGVGQARRRMRAELRASGTPDSVVEDAVLILSEMLSNSCRHARPLSPDDSIRADWSRDAGGELTISVTDGGGPTRPLPATPSVTAHGGRGLSIITSLARDWGVREDGAIGGVTVWAVVAPANGFGTARGFGLIDIESIDEIGEMNEIDELT